MESPKRGGYRVWAKRIATGIAGVLVLLIVLRVAYSFVIQYQVDTSEPLNTSNAPYQVDNLVASFQADQPKYLNHRVWVVLTPDWISNLGSSGNWCGGDLSWVACWGTANPFPGTQPGITLESVCVVTSPTESYSLDLEHCSTS